MVLVGTVPALHPVYRLSDLLYSPWLASSDPLPETTQAPPQVDHANAICEPCIPPSRWLDAEYTIPYVPIHLPNAEVLLNRHLRIRQHLDCLHPYALPPILTPNPN